MSHPARFAAGLFGLVPVAVVALAIGLWWETRGLVTEVAVSHARAERLDAAAEGVRQRRAAGDALAHSLIDGHAVLTVAARAFFALHENEPEFHRCLELCYTGQNRLESACRALADRAYWLVTDPAERDQLVRRLTAEFRTAFPRARPLEFEPFPEQIRPQKPPGVAARVTATAVRVE